MRETLALLGSLLLGEASVAGAVSVLPYPSAPPAKPLPPAFLGAHRTAVTTDLIAADGVLDEPAWRLTTPSPDPRAISGEAPPPDADMYTLVTPAGLAVTFTNVPTDAVGGISLEPDSARRGWIQVNLDGADVTIQDCRAQGRDGVMPFPDQWSVHTFECGPKVRAQGARGARGWEVLLPWTLVHPATDELRLHAWFRAAGSSATWDPNGAGGPYGQGRPLEIAGRIDRGDQLSMQYRREDRSILATLSTREMEGPETWVLEVWRSGVLLHRDFASLTPQQRQATAAFVIPLSEWHGLNLLARRVGPDGIQPGARAYPWLMTHGGNLASVVVEGVIEIRYALSNSEKPDIVVRDEVGSELLRESIQVGGGFGAIRIPVDPAWPDTLRVSAGNLLEGGEQTVVRAGRAARLGAR